LLLIVLAFLDGDVRRDCVFLQCLRSALWHEQLIGKRYCGYSSLHDNVNFDVALYKSGRFMLSSSPRIALLDATTVCSLRTLPYGRKVAAKNFIIHNDDVGVNASFEYMRNYDSW